VDSLEYLGPSLKQNNLYTRFDKQLNTFYLNSRLKLIMESEKIDFLIDENFNSTHIRLPQSSTKDEQHLSIKSLYKYSPKFNIGLLGSSTVLSDNRTLEINQASVSFVTIFSEIEPLRNILFSPFAGYSRNSQIGENDHGLVYGIEGITNNLLLSDFRLNSEIRLRNEDIMPRRNLNRYFQLSAANYFDVNVSNTINFLYSRSRKDFYFQTDSETQQKFNIINNIQSRTESIYSLQDRLTYDRILDALSMSFAGIVSMRSVDRDTRYKNRDVINTSIFDTRIEELKLELETLLRYSSELFDGHLRFAFSERDEKNITKPFKDAEQSLFDQRSEIESQKNNNSGRLALTFFGDLKISDKEKITLSYFQSKLKYDTPSNQNDDDRDEILSILRIRYTKFLNPYFEAFINAEGTYAHIVYIFAGRSSNNNVNRILRLKAGGDYRGRKISSYNSFEVSANYTVYDFEDLSSNFQSFSFRQMTALDSTTIRLTDRISLSAYGSVKLSEQGDFRWQGFASRPTRFLQEIYVEPRIILHLERSSFSTGLRYFSLNTYNFNKLKRIPDTEYFSFGPIVVINTNIWKRLNININGFYEFIRSSGNIGRQQANLMMEVNWKF
jgi:hypothetical protein